MHQRSMHSRRGIEEIKKSKIRFYSNVLCLTMVVPVKACGNQKKTITPHGPCHDLQSPLEIDHRTSKGIHRWGSPSNVSGKITKDNTVLGLLFPLHGQNLRHGL